MVARLCASCGIQRALIRRPKTHQPVCKECFFQAVEDEVHQTITSNKLFRRGEKVAIAVSGGKDSTVLAHILTTLNTRHEYALDLFLLSVDEGITGYRDDSLETVRRNQGDYGIPLRVVSFKELYGWSMDEIVQAIGRRNNCTFCGVFRRQALDRGCILLGAEKIATGHNADDVAETVLMNILRGDVARLQRCTATTTGTEGRTPRVKPFMFTYEKEIVMYAHFKKLHYFSTECTYAPNAYRGHARAFLKDLEALRPRSIIDIIHSGQRMSLTPATTSRMPELGSCEECGYLSSQRLCQSCILLKGLNTGRARLAIGRTRGADPRAYEKKENHP